MSVMNHLKLKKKNKRNNETCTRNLLYMIILYVNICKNNIKQHIEITITTTRTSAEQQQQKVNKYDKIDRYAVRSQDLNINLVCLLFFFYCFLSLNIFFAYLMVIFFFCFGC